MSENAVTQYETILCEKKGMRTTITLNRPEKRNATNTKLYEELLDAARAADADPETRVVILTGAGTVFCAGQDQSVTSKQDKTTYEHYNRVNFAAHDFLKTMRKPVIGRINGPAAGGGCVLALVTVDIVVASTTARFALREISTGLSGPLPLLYSVGRPRALFMAMTGAWVSAQQAEQWGLIYKCAAPEQLDAEVDAVAQLLEAVPPLGVAATKTKMNFALSLLQYTAIHEFGLQQDLFLHTTEDRKEAQRAFLDKRKPVYQGR
ncbi:MAG: enoyl-CoA hydratase/isomerase family protein [Bryobacteraceae bacterium]